MAAHDAEPTTAQTLDDILVLAAKAMDERGCICKEHAACNMQHMQHAVQHAACSTQHATRADGHY